MKLGRNCKVEALTAKGITGYVSRSKQYTRQRYSTMSPTAMQPKARGMDIAQRAEARIYIRKAVVFIFS